MQQYIRMTEGEPFAQEATPTLSMRCPVCKKHGTFDQRTDDFRLSFDVPCQGRGTFIGLRRCPDPECRCFVVWLYTAKVTQPHLEAATIKTYPAETIDFDPKGIPWELVANIGEDITCNANGCYVAAAIMIRRTMEFLCETHKAKGDNLQKRIEALSQTIVLPKKLIKGLDRLRLLGNDAAHVESKIYGKIGKKHIEVSMKFLKEVLKATYQHDDLIAELESLEQ